MLAKRVSLGFMVPINKGVWGEIDNKGFSTAHFAAKYAEIEALNLLHVFNPEMLVAPNKYGVTPAHLAAANGHVEVLMLFKSIDKSMLEAVSLIGWNLGHFAAQNGHVNVIKFLNEADIDLDKKDMLGETPMLIAHQLKHYNCVREIMYKPSISSCNIL